MKKIISMGVASAVLALTAVAASAEATTGTLKVAFDQESFGAGDEITATVTLTGNADSAQFYVKTEGLTLKKYEGTKNVQIAMMNDDTTSDKFGMVSLSLIKEPGAVLTLTYEVTAAEGTEAKIYLAADPNDSSFDGMVDPTDVATVVAGAASNNSGEPGSSDVADSNDSSNTNNGEGNANTGIALAIVPAVIAGAAVVVAAKKRK